LWFWKGYKALLNMQLDAKLESISKVISLLKTTVWIKHLPHTLNGTEYNVLYQNQVSCKTICILSPSNV